MEDYPVDQDGAMSEAHHASKLLSGVSGSVCTPSVRVQGKIYFTDELLQLQSLDYFIPKRFFRGAMETDGVSQDSKLPLYAVGWIVSRKDVS